MLPHPASNGRVQEGKPLIMTLVPDFEIMKFYLPTTILTPAVFHLFFLTLAFMLINFIYSSTILNC